jgi:hypothetical protein
VTDPVLVGEVLEFADGRWRVVHLGERVAVRDRRRVVVDRPPMFPPKR